MAIPAMITQMGQQQLNYGMSVGQSLQRLGQQVGQQLAQKEYQRQAAEALPAMQESYKQAFEKIQRGDISEGYMDVLNTGMQFGSNQNPFLMGFIEQANKFAKEAGDVTLSQGWQNIQRGGGAAAAMGDGAYVPSTQELLSGTYTQTPTATSIPAMRGAGGGFSFDGDTQDSIDQDAFNNLPQEEPDLGAPISEFPQGVREGFSFGGGAYSGPSKYQPPQRIIEESAASINKYASGTTSDKREFNRKNSVSSYAGEPISLQGIIGFDNTFVTPPEEILGEKGRSAQKKYTSKGEEATLKIDTGVTNQDEINAFNAAIQNARYASQFVKSNRDLSGIAEAVNNDWTRVKTDRSTRNNETTFTASIDNGDPIQLDEEEYKQLTILTAALPAVLEQYGSKYIEQPQPAPAGASVQQGMPAAQLPETREPIAETEPLRQQLAAKQAEESKKTAAQRQKRVTEINKEIEKLQVGTIDKPTGITRMDIASIARPTESRTTTKTSKQIERDIAKIEQLVAERDRLEGKTPTRNLSPKDQEALEWLNANPNHPQANAVRQKLGI
jgi:hypothetical protein